MVVNGKLWDYLRNLKYFRIQVHFTPLFLLMWNLELGTTNNHVVGWTHKTKIWVSKPQGSLQFAVDTKWGYKLFIVNWPY